MTEKLICFLIGHNDPVMSGIGIVSEEELYKMWDSIPRKCERCGKQLLNNSV